jgi:curved DNA-binding protein CbpA
MMFQMTRSFAEAREVLGVPHDGDAQVIRRAYRKAVAASPPDRDPEGFRRIRDAYELLSDPLARAEKILFHPVPHEPPPPLPQLPVSSAPGPLCLSLLRAALGRMTRDAILGAPSDKKGAKP